MTAIAVDWCWCDWGCDGAGRRWIVRRDPDCPAPWHDLPGYDESHETGPR